MNTPGTVLAAGLLDEAVARLRKGELVAFPTETVYGLGGDATNARAVARIYQLKGRPSSHPLIVHLGSGDSLDRYARAVPAAARSLAAAFWPGPLTLVLPRGAHVVPEATGGQDTVALRMPDHPVAQALLGAFGGVLAAPSANRYGRISPTTAGHVRDEFGSDAPLVLDGGACRVGLESTIVGWVAGELTLLRPGQISVASIETVAGPVRRLPASTAPRVSGSDVSHYAPHTPARLVERPALAADGSGVAVLARHRCPGDFAGVAWLLAPADAEDYARLLYTNLRRLDALSAREIRVEPVPDESAWDAVRDRLARATAGASSR